MSLVNTAIGECGSILFACVMSLVDVVIGEIGGILVAMLNLRYSEMHYDANRMSCRL